ncbi:trehalose-phosphatase [Candidatus Velamenicoccus archaeovorus]|nr:trehalose-phosphatase [Candidatus Velamenicoccus archaeovorus]
MMKSLFRDWDRIRQRIRQHPLLICLDYDGTLSPIAPTPPQAVLPTKTKQVLRTLAAVPGVLLAVISGRAISDLKSMIGLKNIVYSGNHGFEAEGSGVRFKIRIPSAYNRVIARLERTLKDRYKTIRGVVVENKKPFLAVHYRLAEKNNFPSIRGIFRETVKEAAAKNLIRMKTGKMILEIQPPVDWDKGKIVLWLLKKRRGTAKGRNVLPLYVGDDITDEDAFRALKNKGITVFVGVPGTSSAQYYLSNTDKVHKFLERIVLLKSPK